MRIVRFPWYDLPALRPAHQAFWRKLRVHLERDGLRDLPDRVDEDPAHDELLHRDELLCSQTCGYDIALDLPRAMALVATPAYAAPGCRDGHYRSLIVVNRHSRYRSVNDVDRARFVANDPRSWSGYHCARAQWSRFKQIIFSGGHRQSLAALDRDTADVAAIDAITWELLRRHEPERLAHARVIGRTDLAPAPPLVTATATSLAELSSLRRSLNQVSRDERGLCGELLIDGFVVFGPGDYAFMAAPEPTPPTSS